MEMAGTGLDFYATGRLVVFSNSVLFQTGTPLFKQIPGTEYAWHEVVVMIAPSGNHKMPQDKLVAAVNEIYAGYRKEIERQHAGIDRRVDILIATPRPEARLQFADGGLEWLVRYPVEIRKGYRCEPQSRRVRHPQNSVGYQGLAIPTIAWRAGAPATSPTLKSRVTNITAKRN